MSRRLCTGQQGATLVELIAVSSLVVFLLFVASQAELGFARQRAETAAALQATIDLQRGMEPLLREISTAWGDPVSGAPPVTLSPQDAGCSASLLLRFGPDQAVWSLRGGALVRTLNGTPGPPLGEFSSLCFAWDVNQRTVLVTLHKGAPHSLRSGATPWGRSEERRVG